MKKIIQKVPWLVILLLIELGTLIYLIYFVI